MEEKQNVVDDEKRKIFIIDFITDYVLQKIDINDNFRLYRFLYFMVNDNPYLNITDDILIEISEDRGFDLDIEEKTIKKADYCFGTQELRVSKKYFINCLLNKESSNIFSLLHVIFHEREHHLQNKLISEKNEKKLTPEQRDERRILFNRLFVPKKTTNEYFETLSIFENVIESEYFQGFKKLSHEEKMNEAHVLSYAQYFEKKIEEYAREKSIDTLEIFLNSLIKDPKLNIAIRDFIIEEVLKKEIPYLRKYEEASQKFYYGRYDAFQDELKRISVSKFEDIEKYIGNENPKEFDMKNYTKLITLYYDLAEDMVYETSYNTLYYLYFDSIEKGLPKMADLAFSRLTSDEFLENEAKQIKEVKGIDVSQNLKAAVKQILTREDSGEKPFQISYKGLFDENDVVEIIEKLMENKKIHLVFEFLMDGGNWIQTSKKVQDRLFQLLCEYRFEILNKIKNRKKDIICGDLEIMYMLFNYLSDLLNINDKIKIDFANTMDNKIKKFIEKRNETGENSKMDEELIRKIYGDKYLNDINEDFINSKKAFLKQKNEKI